jgi:hypothetical protein
LAEIEITSIMREGKKSMEAIPGVRSISTSRTIQPDGKYSYCLSISLASQAAAEVFQNHPLYQRFANKVFLPMLTDHITLDFEES